MSVLVLAHTPKRSLDCPITSNDLAGSKRLYNFFDSVFAIGKSAQDGGLRYVKQLKVRYGTFSHDADNVIIYEIEKVDAFLQFVFRGYSTEKEHLKKLGDNESSQRDCQILQLSQSGKSVRGDSLTGELRQVHRQPDNPAQQGGQECSRPKCPAVPTDWKWDNGTAWDKWDSKRSKSRQSCLWDMGKREDKA